MILSVSVHMQVAISAQRGKGINTHESDFMDKAYIINMYSLCNKNKII